jgi:diguanylate cyclase (GGDEF)-like protein/PAS domain S-box-containing protein
VKPPPEALKELEDLLDGLAPKDRDKLRQALDGVLRTELDAAQRMTTELSEAERGRRAAEVRFRKAFENAPIGVALADLNDHGRFLLVNHALVAISGRSHEDLLATSLDDVTLADDRESDSAQRQSLVSGAFDSYMTEKRLLHADGHPIWTQISLSMAQDTGDEAPFAVVQIQDISQRRRFEHRLHYLANHDALTGLANRRRFLSELERQVTHNARYGGRGAVLMLDIDRFKLVNDRLGHQAGDNLLRRVASLLRDRVRTTDAVARFAGDEFAVLMPQTNTDGALHLGQELRRELKARLGAETGPGKVTVSIGVTMFNGQDGGEINTVLAAADSAMYRAKERGRDRVELLDEDEVDPSADGRGLSNPARIREALTADGLVLHSQPIIDLSTDRAVRHELLVRLPDSSGVPLAASTFIGTAEQFGMVQELDRWVIGQALALLARQQRLDRETNIHVNLSGASLTDVSVLEFIERELDTGDAIGTGITFEITETAAVRNFDTAAEFADRLTEFGCSVAIDDFGAGFGPFYYLKHLPFDVIKIDGEFVRDLPRSDADRLTVEAIVNIAHGLGKQTIAEFVEEAGTVDILRELGVDMAQGFHLGRPEPIANGN